MTLGQCVKKIVGAHLEKYGFVYESNGGGSYSFLKTEYPDKLDQPELSIDIYKVPHRENTVSFIYVVSNVGVTRRGDNVDEMQGCYSHPLFKMGEWHYNNDQELIAILEEFNRLFDGFVLKRLQEMSAPDTDLYENFQMEKDLYEGYKTYSNREIINEQLIKMSRDEFVDYIAQQIMQIKENELIAQRERCMILAALWGQKLVQQFKGYWAWRERSRTCYIGIPYHGRNKRCEIYEYPLSEIICNHNESSIEKVRENLMTKWDEIDKKYKGIKDKIPDEILAAIKESEAYSKKRNKEKNKYK